MPTCAGSELMAATPPTEQTSSVIIPVITARMTGVRCRRAAARSSRIQTGFGSLVSRCQRVFNAKSPRTLGGGGGIDANAGLRAHDSSPCVTSRKIRSSSLRSGSTLTTPTPFVTRWRTTSATKRRRRRSGRRAGRPARAPRRGCRRRRRASARRRCESPSTRSFSRLRVASGIGAPPGGDERRRRRRGRRRRSRARSSARPEARRSAISPMGPATTSSPCSRMPTDVQTSLSSVRMWLERKMVLPSSRSSSKRSRISMRARGIEIARRLVEDQDLRIVEQDARDLQALLHALAERHDQTILELLQLGELDHRVDDAELGDAVGVGEELEELAHRDALVHAGVVRHVADDAPHALGIDGHVDAVDLDAPGRRLEQRRHDADGGGLAGAVRADEAEDLAVADLEAHVAQHVERAVAVPQVVRADRGYDRGYGCGFAHGDASPADDAHEHAIDVDASSRCRASCLRRRRAGRSAPARPPPRSRRPGRLLRALSRRRRGPRRGDRAPGASSAAARG